MEIPEKEALQGRRLRRQIRLYGTRKGKCSRRGGVSGEEAAGLVRGGVACQSAMGAWSWHGGDR